jgi:subtilase family serine protease
VRPQSLRSLLAVTVTAAAVTVPITLGSPAGADGLFAITQNVLPGLANAADLGAAPSAPLDLVVTLARPDPAGEQALIAAEHDPASPQYRHFLTPAQFTEQFGVPAGQRAAVTSFLTGGGLALDHVSAAGDVYSVHGSAAAVGALLHTSVRSYSLDGATFVANTSAPVFPAGLGIKNISGLNTLQHYSAPAKMHHAQGTCLPGGIACIPTCVPLLGCTGGTTPQDLWSVYQQPAAHTGAGQQLAIFGEGQSDDVISDLRAFEAHFALPQIPVHVVHPAGDTDFGDDAGRPEWDIDTQASSGMAPNADSLSMYWGSDLSDADVDRVFSTFTDDAAGPKQASASYGECETIPTISPLVAQGFDSLGLAALPIQFGLGNNNDATLDQITRQAAAEGKTIFVSSGDTGSSCPIVALPVVGAGNGILNQVVPVTSSPASLPYVTAVGGTVLYTDGAGHRTREYGWAFSGGGSTLFTPAPAYQAGTAGVNLPCVTDLSVTCRGIADVSAQSGDVLGNGYDIVLSGSFTEGGGGGTSLSSPLWEGMWTRVQSAAPTAAGNGFANYALYQVGRDAGAYARDFFDVNSLDLATGLPATNGLYATTPGWDYVTGFGAPRVSGLICDIDGC